MHRKAWGVASGGASGCSEPHPLPYSLEPNTSHVRALESRREQRTPSTRAEINECPVDGYKGEHRRNLRVWGEGLRRRTEEVSVLYIVPAESSEGCRAKRGEKETLIKTERDIEQVVKALVVSSLVTLGLASARLGEQRARALAHGLGRRAEQRAALQKRVGELGAAEEASEVWVERQRWLLVRVQAKMGAV